MVICIVFVEVIAMRTRQFIRCFLLWNLILLANQAMADPLHDAVNSGDIDKVSALLERGEKINAIDTNGDSPLGYAVKTRNQKLIKLLLEHKADINQKNYVGNTPLIGAIEIGDIEIARLLIEHGADIDVKNNMGATPKVIAKGVNNKKMVRLLKLTRLKRLLRSKPAGEDSVAGFE